MYQVVTFDSESFQLLREISDSLKEIAEAQKNANREKEQKPISDDIQHVGYDEEQCGRTK